MKPLVIYHANCADGFGAAFAAWLKLGDNAQYLPWQYTDPKKESVEQEWERLSAALLPEGNTGREVYVLDFSFRREIMDKLIDMSAHFVWRDHHKTAFEMWCGRYKKGLEYDQIGDIGDIRSTSVDIFLDDSKSGAMLAWEYFHPDTTEVPALIKLIDDYDRWQFKLIGTKEVNKAIWSYTPWSFEQWNVWLNDWELMHDSAMMTEGLAILRAHEQNVRAVVKGAGMKCRIGDEELFVEGMMANCPPHLQSDVGHQLANACGTFGLLWHINHEGKILCSLRGAKGYDTTPIAKAFGGGGHAAASGFTCPDMNTLLSWMRP